MKTLQNRIVLIGNAPIKRKLFNKTDYSHFVDSSSIVIRMNKAPNWNKKTGTKTTQLGLINIGTPAIEFAYATKLPITTIQNIESVIFSRPKQIPPQSKLLQQFDLSEYILSFQNLSHLTPSYISSTLYQSLVKKVNTSPSEKYEPSSGFCLLFYLLEQEKYKDLPFYLLGFTWEGWQGHNWQQEQKECLALQQQNRIKILPI